MSIPASLFQMDILRWFSNQERVETHLLHFTKLHEQLTAKTVDETWLRKIEWLDNIFPEVNYRYWA